MTAKELLLHEAPTWSEEQAVRALRAVHVESEEIVDDWGNLSATLDNAAGDLMRRLAQEEATAGHDPW